MGHIPFLFTFMYGVFWQWKAKGAIVLFALAIFAMGMVFLGWHLKQRYQVKEAERIRNIIKSMRHDWMNHVQVIMGYQLMKQYDKVDQYLQKLTNRSSEERIMSELPYPPLAATLLTIPYDYAQWNWRVRQDDAIRSLSIQHQQKLYQILKHLLPWIANRMKSQVAWTEIEFDLSYKDQCFFFVFRFVGKDDIKQKVQPVEWGTLPKRLRWQKASYDWSEDEHTLLIQIPIR